jgi:hypothetical protein
MFKLTPKAGAPPPEPAATNATTAVTTTQDPRAHWQAPDLSCLEGIAATSNLRTKSMQSKSEQQAMLLVYGTKANGQLELGGKVYIPRHEESISLVPDPFRPEIKVADIAAALFNHVQSEDPNRFERFVEKFIEIQAERFLSKADLIKMNYLDDPALGDTIKHKKSGERLPVKTELTAADIRELANGIATTPWQIINTPELSLTTKFGSDSIEAAKKACQAIGIHSHPYLTPYPELNELLITKSAQWGADDIYDLFESSSAQKVIQNLLNSKAEFLTRLVNAETIPDLPLTTGPVLLDEHSQKIFSRLRSLAAQEGVTSDTYNQTLATEILNCRKACSDLAAVADNPGIGIIELQNLAGFGNKSLGGTFGPCDSDITMARDQGRGKLTPESEAYYEIIVNPIGIIAYQGVGNKIRVWTYNLFGNLIAEPCDIDI